jgi:hypothetical protein
MGKTRWNRAAIGVAAAGLAAASWIALESVWGSSAAEHAGTSAPMLVLKRTSRDFGTVSQGAVLQASFTVENAGARRLVLVEKRGGCCGQSTGPQSIVLEPGEKKDLDVEADTARWFGRMDHRAAYFTNDPATPRFSLHMTATVTAPPSP